MNPHGTRLPASAMDDLYCWDCKRTLRQTGVLMGEHPRCMDCLFKFMGFDHQAYEAKNKRCNLCGFAYILQGERQHKPFDDCTKDSGCPVFDQFAPPPTSFDNPALPAANQLPLPSPNALVKNV